MTRRNPTTTTAGGRKRETKWSVLVKRLGRSRLVRDELQPRVVRDGDNGAALYLTMRDGDVIESRFPHALVALHWLAGNGFNRVELDGATWPLYPTEDAHRTFDRVLCEPGPSGWLPRAFASTVAYQLYVMWADAFKLATSGPQFDLATAICHGVRPYLMKHKSMWVGLTAHREQSAELVLQVANDVMGGNGVEPVVAEGRWVDVYYQNIVALYVNLGDTYDDTLLYSTSRARWRWESWGNFVERNRL